MAGKISIWILALIVIAVMLVSGCTSESSKGVVSSSLEREYINDTWDSLDKIYFCRSFYTQLQRDEMWSQFEGKYVTWVGEVYFVSSDLKVKFRRVFYRGDECQPMLQSYANVHFSQSQKEDLLQLKEGDIIKFQGKLVRPADEYSWEAKPWELTDGKIIEKIEKEGS